MRQCARCRKKKKASEYTSTGTFTSRLICADCLQAIWEDRLKNSREVMDSFEVPILLLDNTYRIKGANELARKILGRPLPDIENHLPGDAMECINARLPGGCGKSYHCQACALRKALEKTVATGKDLENIPAYQDVYQKDGSTMRKFLYISTEKLEDFILLTIEDVETLRTMQAGRRVNPDPNV